MGGYGATTVAAWFISVGAGAGAGAGAGGVSAPSQETGPWAGPPMP